MNNIYRLVALTLLASTSTLTLAEDSVASVESKPITVNAATIQAAASTPALDVSQKGEKTILVSPRTGMRYVLTNPANRTVIFQTEALAPVTAQNVSRITASNPALSAQSQAQAEKALLDMAGIAAAPAVTAPVEVQQTAAN